MSTLVIPSAGPFTQNQRDKTIIVDGRGIGIGGMWGTNEQAAVTTKMFVDAANLAYNRPEDMDDAKLWEEIKDAQTHFWDLLRIFEDRHPGLSLDTANDISEISLERVISKASDHAA